MSKKYGDYTYIFVLALCIFLYAPLALIFPYGSSLSSHIFYFVMPHVFIASTASLIYCLCNAHLLSLKCKVFKTCLAAVGLMTLSGIIFDSPLFKIIESAAFFTVPLAISILRTKHQGNRNALLYIIASCWALSVFFCLIWPGNTKIGFAGNQNWLAATVLSSYIFLIVLLKEKIASKAFIATSLLTGAVSAYILYCTHARVIIPALIASFIFLSLKKLSKKQNIMIFTTGLVIVSGLFFYKKDYIQRTYNADVRGPLTKGTLSMIMQSPLLGHGAGHFQRDFPEFANDQLKQRAVYSPVVEHPHNEWLHLAANSGLIVAFLWLFLLWLSWTSKEENNKLLLQIAVIILFVMGLADKPLVTSSSAIIFLMATGLCLPHMKVPDKVFSHQKICILAAVIITFFGCFRLSQAIPAQYSFWQAKKLYSFLGKSGKQELLEPLYELYNESTQSDPYLLEPHYHKASMLAQRSSNLDLIQNSLEDVILLAPNYADINYQISHYYLRQAKFYPDSKEESLQEAETYILKNVELSPWSVKRNRQLVRFYCQNQQFDKALSALNQLKEICRQKLRIRYSYNDKSSLDESIQYEKEKTRNGQFSLNLLANSMKANKQDSYLYPGTLRNDAIASSYNKNDERFWQEKLLINQKVIQEGLNSFKAIEKLIQSLQIDKSYPIQRPWQTWQSQKASPLSLAALMSEICRQNNWDNGLSLSEQETSLLIFLDEEILKLNCHTKEFMLLTANDLKKMDKVQLIIEPEQLTLRNHLISDLLSINGASELCQSATELSLRLMKKLNTKIAIEPFLIKTPTLVGPQ